MIITIDGPVASGKSTLAKGLSKEINAFYICSGLFYRAFAYILLEIIKIDIKNEKELLTEIEKINLSYLNDKDFSPIIIYKDINITNFLNNEKIAESASLISPYSRLRSIINKIQQDCVNEKNYKNFIIDGRDCGISVFPNANLKFYITASINSRISRIKNRNYRDEETNNKLIKFILDRDFRDSTRKVSPAKPAFDSYIIDTSYMNIEEILNFIKKFIK
jgi:cytidylate kinase